MLYHKGSVVLTEDPFVHVLMQSEREQRCDECLEMCDKLLRCTACKMLYYCGTKCQKKNWKLHKEECPLLKNCAPKVPTDSVRLLFKLIQKFKINNPKDVGINGNTETRLKDLMSHASEIKEDVKRNEEFAKICYTLSKFIDGKKFELPPLADVLDLFGKMCINSFTICDGEMQAIGVGIYMNGSRLNHSCLPNAVAVFSGKQLTVRSTTDIDADEEILISYIEQLGPSAERQRYLKSSYYFDCTCPRCRDKDLDGKMLACKCPGLNCEVPITTQGALSCPACNADLSATYWDEQEQAALKAKQLIAKSERLRKQRDWDSLINFDNDPLVRRLLHETNVYRVTLQMSAMDGYINLEQWDKAVESARFLAQPVMSYYPPNSPMIGVHLMKLGKLELYIKQNKSALQHLQQAETILKVSHGVNHTLYKDLTSLLDQCMEELRVTLDQS
ncbi:unnamed protein product [Owenia fusiformis]|uniref:Uncharacterized protein n=1 Tax=Owenia fusiformis TaxID=6347 RepID=A0A8J1XVZ0_OWEFU|nr:unnamed protein product [Owenia fusiformis]